MGILANPIAVWLLFFACAVTFVVVLWALFSDLDGGAKVAVVVISLIVFVSVGAGWIYGATHRVVPPNERWVILNTASGQVDGNVRSSGVTTKPFIMYTIRRYPGVTEQPFCIEYTPALKEGYEVATRVCGTYDAASLDWAQMYLRYNFGDETQMLTYWANQSKELVSAALRNVDYTTITTDRAGVSEAIRTNLTPWFTDFGVSVANIQLTNWDFTSSEVRAQVDAASAASMKKTVETQLLAAARVARERQLFEVETANLVLAERGLGLQTLFTSLGITDDGAKASIAGTMTWYTYATNPPPGVQVILGVGGMPIAAPVNVQPVPATTP